MINVEVTPEVRKKAQGLRIEGKLNKQINFLKNNPRHPSLRFRRYVELKGEEIWKFEIDLNWWALTLRSNEGTVRVFRIIHHP